MWFGCHFLLEVALPSSVEFQSGPSFASPRHVFPCDLQVPCEVLRRVCTSQDLALHGVGTHCRIPKAPRKSPQALECRAPAPWTEAQLATSISQFQNMKSGIPSHLQLQLPEFLQRKGKDLECFVRCNQLDVQPDLRHARNVFNKPQRARYLITAPIFPLLKHQPEKEIIDT